MTKTRKRRTYKEIFMDELEKLSNGEQKFIGNKTLRDQLGWDEDGYNWTKEELKNEKKVIAGQGRGGSVALAKSPGIKGLSVFISYSHADESLKNELVKHLKPLERLGLIATWHDRKLKAGEEWDHVISKQLEGAEIVLLLISIDFINSAYSFDVELEKALAMHQKGNARVIPIVLRNCLWGQMPFSKLQALPKDAKAVTSWENTDDAFTNIADEIRKVADELMDTK